MTALDIIRGALQEIGVINATDPPSAEDAALGLEALNRLLDNWNADRRAIYADTFTTYTLTPALSPHTLGPSGATFTASQRPVSIEGAAYVADGARTPILVRDASWWASRFSTTETSDIPTDLYYDPAWSNGKLWFYPIPSAACDVEIWTRAVLASLTLVSTFSLPPGYQDAVTKTLAEDLAPSFLVPLSPKTEEKARIARGRIFNNHAPNPRIASDTAFIGSECGDWDYLSGRYR